VSAARQKLLAVVLALAAAALGFMLAWKNADRPPEATDPASAPQLLALKLPDVADRHQALEQWRGKVIVANFWATWCPPCLEEIPVFDRIHRKYSDKGVQFVGISIDSADKVRAFADQHRLSYPLLIGSADTLQVTTGLGNRMQALPFTVIVDRTGVPHKIKLGKLSEADLEAALLRLL
jgi:peroxiredoxin